MAPIVCGGSVFVVVWNALLYVHFNFSICNHIDEEERAGCFAFIVFRMSCYCKCTVALPYDAVGWSAVCDCCISYSLSYFLEYLSSQVNGATRY